jgi:predicted phage-related endonuclease
MANRPILKKIDLADLTEIMEGFVSDYERMSDHERIDLAAHLKPVAKACKTIDEQVKDMVKGVRKGKEGTVYGKVFKAVLSLVPTTRLDQKGLKENEPDIYAEYNKGATDQKITFELR